MTPCFRTSLIAVRGASIGGGVDLAMHALKQARKSEAGQVNRTTTAGDSETSLWCSDRKLFCNHSFISTRCKATCAGTCSDVKTSVWCTNRKLSCNHSFISTRCKATCGACPLREQHAAPINITWTPAQAESDGAAGASYINDKLAAPKFAHPAAITDSLVSDRNTQSGWPRHRTVRVMYVIIANNASGDWDGSVRALALRHGWLRAVSPADVWLHPVRHRLNNPEFGAESGALYFDAFRDALRARGPASWYMVCDDDTHVDPVAVSAFVQNASAQTVYGNVYDTSKVVHCPQPNGRSARRRGGWLTGGSGMLMPGAVVQRIVADSGNIMRWASLGKSCHCGDMPLSCALSDLARSAPPFMARIAHTPQLFLDSCLYCADFLVPRRILSCHAASAFRSFNRYASDKGPLDSIAVNGSFAFRIDMRRNGRSVLPYKYSWPASTVGVHTYLYGPLTLQLSKTAMVDRMRTVQEDLCPPTSMAPPRLYCTPDQTAHDLTHLSDSRMVHRTLRCIVG